MKNLKKDRIEMQDAILEKFNESSLKTMEDMIAMALDLLSSEAVEMIEQRFIKANQSVKS